MKRILFAAIILIGMLANLSAQGLRHSVCYIEPKFTDAEKTLMEDYALYMARAGFLSAAQALTSYKSEGTFGSGVVIEVDSNKYILTNLHVIAYAKSATITFQLHDKKLRYADCQVVATSQVCDLAVIKLPQACEMVPLALFSEPTTDDMPIVAAGFPALAKKPSWQMTRGFISNARVESIESSSASHILQHTAAIDPGSSGGPLLFKGEDGKYKILGINTWKAFYRDDVGLAIGTDDITAFLKEMHHLGTKDAEDLEQIKNISGEDWIYIFKQTPDSSQKQIKEIKWRLPFDQALRTLAVRDSILSKNTKQSNKFKRSATHVDTDLERRNEILVTYDNYFGTNQQIGLQIGHSWLGYISTGVRFAALISNVMAIDEMYRDELGYQNRGGVLFGLYVGGQVPISIDKYTLVPRITQSAGAGPMKTGDVLAGFNIVTDTRIGLDWRIPFSFCDLAIGLHYNMNWLWTKDQMSIPTFKPKKDSNGLGQYLQHGIGISLGIIM